MQFLINHADGLFLIIFACIFFGLIYQRFNRIEEKLDRGERQMQHIYEKAHQIDTDLSHIQGRYEGFVHSIPIQAPSKRGRKRTAKEIE